MEILQFVFGSFWRWLGFAILLGIAVSGLGGFIKVNLPKIDRRP
jgi:hypothetical protein